MYLDGQLNRSKRHTNIIVEKIPGKEFMWLWLCWMPHDEHVILTPAYREAGILCANLASSAQVLPSSICVSPQLVKGVIAWLVVSWR
jgi:hypothetical protein